MELESDLGSHVPAESRADDPGPEVVVACLWVAKHDGKVFRDVVQDDQQRVFGVDVLLRVEDSVSERLLVFRQGEIVRIAGGEELQNHFHQFLARQLGARKIL